MSDDLGFKSGVIITAVLCLLLATWFWKPYRDDIDSCERDLPRNERCILIAVPEMEATER